MTQFRWLIYSFSKYCYYLEKPKPPKLPQVDKPLLLYKYCCRLHFTQPWTGGQCLSSKEDLIRTVACERVTTFTRHRFKLKLQSKESVLTYINFPWINSHRRLSWKKWMLNASGLEETGRNQWVWLGELSRKAGTFPKGPLSFGGGFGQRNEVASAEPQRWSGGRSRKEMERQEGYSRNCTAERLN